MIATCVGATPDADQFLPGELTMKRNEMRMALCAAMLATAGAVLGASATSEAQMVMQQQGWNPHHHQHNQGRFFLRGGLGLGYGNFTARAGAADITLTGAGLTFNGALGFSVAPNFALHADVNLMSIVQPRVTLSGAGVSGGGYDTENDYTSTMLGVGFTYYMMPTNLYVSGSVGLALMRAEFSGTSATRAESGLGFGINAMAGHDWWISNTLGFGIGLQLQYHRVPDSDPWFRGVSDAPVWQNFGISAFASLTSF